MSKKQETAQPNTNQTNTGNEVDPIASAEQRKAENAKLLARRSESGVAVEESKTHGELVAAGLRDECDLSRLNFRKP